MKTKHVVLAAFLIGLAGALVLAVRLSQKPTPAAVDESDFTVQSVNEENSSSESEPLPPSSLSPDTEAGPETTSPEAQNPKAIEPLFSTEPVPNSVSTDSVREETSSPPEQGIEPSYIPDESFEMPSTDPGDDATDD